MSGGEIAQIILALATFVTAVGGVLISLRNTRKIDEVHRTTNSLAERTEGLARDAGHAEGELKGRTDAAKERVG